MDEEVKASKLYAIESSMKTIKILKTIIKELEKDLKDNANEDNQHGAVLALRTFYEFIIQDSGYNAWHHAIEEILTKEFKRRGLH
jgi:hypothetical protein